MKDLTIQWLVEEVADGVGREVDVIDHWDADEFAIGFKSQARAGRFVYVSSWERPLGTYHFECDTDGETTESGTVGVAELLAVLRRHLNC